MLLPISLGVTELYTYTQFSNKIVESKHMTCWIESTQSKTETQILLTQWEWERELKWSEEKTKNQHQSNKFIEYFCSIRMNFIIFKIGFVWFLLPYACFYVNTVIYNVICSTFSPSLSIPLIFTACFFFSLHSLFSLRNVDTRNMHSVQSSKVPRVSIFFSLVLWVCTYFG